MGLPYELKVYKRDPITRLAPAELKKIHPLGKSPVITDGTRVVAESGAIIEYLVETYGTSDKPEPQHLWPTRGSEAHHQNRFWMHYAEGSLMNWLVMKLVFGAIPTQPMPFFVRPVARAIANNVQTRLIDPNLQTALQYMEAHLSQNTWFTGEHLAMADFQMSFAVEAALLRGGDVSLYPHVLAYKAKINARPAYQRAIAKGGPVLMTPAPSA